MPQNADTITSIINGVLILTSVAILYITHSDEHHQKFIRKVKNDYKKDLQSQIKKIITDINTREADNDLVKLKTELHLFQVYADNIINEEPCFHKRFLERIFRLFQNLFHSNRTPHYATHYHFLLLLLGAIISLSAFTQILNLLHFLCKGTFEIISMIIAILISITFLLVITYPIRAHFQRSRFNAFKEEFVKKLSILKASYPEHF